MVIMLFGLSLLSYAALDVKFTTGIAQSPNPASAGNTVTFTVSLISEGAIVNNLKLIGGVDGTQIVEKIFAGIAAGGTRTQTMTWTAIAGSHKVWFELDPAHTAADSNYDNNKAELPFTVTGGGGTSLVWDTASFVMSPPSPKAGETITFTMNMNVLKGPVGNLKIMMGIDGKPKLGGNYIHWDAGSTFPVSFNWASYVGNHTVYFDIDPDHTTNDENFADNHFEQAFTPQDVGTSLQWQEDSFTMVPASPNFDDEIMFRMDFKVEAAPVDNLKVVGKVDGKVIYERVFPTVALGWNHSFAASWKAMSAGNHTLSLILDPNQKTNDQSFADNTYTKIFSIPQPPTGSAPNLTIKNLLVKPKKLNYTEGENVKICFSVVNTGTIASPSAQVTVSKDGNIFINYQGTDILNPGQSFSPCFDFTYSCKKIEIVVDPKNVVIESDENDNKVSSVQCDDNKLNPFKVKQSVIVH